MAEKSKLLLRMSDFITEPKRMLPPIKGYENQPLITLEQAIQPLISLVPDIEQMVWTVKQNCQNPKDHLTSDESASIMLYTLEWEPTQSSFYFILNAKLRSQNRQELKPWFLYLRLVVYALAKLPSSPSRTIYRGVQIDMSKEFVKDKTFIWWSFSSCTSTIDVIKKFLGDKGPRTIINIECDIAKDISRHSFYGSENEILLYPARQFKMISSIEIGNQFHIIQLKEIQPPFPLIYIPEITENILPTTPMTPIIIISYENQKLKDFIDECQYLSEIDLSNQNLIDEDMNIVVKEAIINKECTELWLNRNSITSVGVSIIAEALNRNTTLEKLVLSDNNVGDMGIHFLTNVLSLNNCSLWQLYLGSTGISDVGVEHLANMLKSNSILSHLFLNRNHISNQGIEVLTSILIHHNNTLQRIDLDENKLVSDACVDILLETLKFNSSLSILDMCNCNLSENGKERLRQIREIKKDFHLGV
jgi:hypothetical protein